MRALPVPGALALFDLAGETMVDGREIAPGRLLRSGYTGPFSPAAVQSLRDYQVTSVIDLRSPRETAKRPGIDLEAPGIRHHSVRVGDDSSTPEPGTCSSLTELYLRLVSQFGAEIAVVAKLIADQGEGSVLVHCATGRDRTGLVVALVLRLIGVPDEVIVARHREVADAVAHYVAYRRLRWLSKGRDPAHFDALHADADAALVAAFGWIDEHFGSTSSYLLAGGAPADLAGRLREVLAPREPAEIRRKAEEVLGPTGSWQLVSSAHSQVWRVPADAGRMSVKLLTDTSSDAQVEERVLAGLGTRWARPILHIIDLGSSGKLVVAPYLDGELMADRLGRAPIPADLGTALAQQYRDFLAAVSALPVPSTGYGRIGSGHTARHLRWSDALRAYLREQQAKGPRTSALCHARLAGALDRLSDRLDAECGPPRLIPTDVNSRNFLITEEKQRLVALNLPVIWQGDPAMPFGPLQLHLDDTPIAAAIADGPWPRWRTHFYAAYHAFVICVYVERFTAIPLPEATPWGRDRPLLELFDRHLQLMGTEL